LYDLRNDPDCVKNLANEPSLQRLKKQLESEMEASLRKDQDPRMLGQGAIFESYRYLGGRAHSYDNWLRFRQ
jgi:N-sulfoglucosamine sulfohydrolase